MDPQVSAIEIASPDAQEIRPCWQGVNKLLNSEQRNTALLYSRCG